MANIIRDISEDLSMDPSRIYLPKNEHEFLFFSSNCWDIHGASNFGFKSVWVNRFNRVNDILPGNPDYIVKNLMDFQDNHL